MIPIAVLQCLCGIPQASGKLLRREVGPTRACLASLWLSTKAHVMSQRARVGSTTNRDGPHSHSCEDGEDDRLAQCEVLLSPANSRGSMNTWLSHGSSLALCQRASLDGSISLACKIDTHISSHSLCTIAKITQVPTIQTFHSNFNSPSASSQPRQIV